jgi:hypothetical protein
MYASDISTPADERFIGGASTGFASGMTGTGMVPSLPSHPVMPVTAAAVNRTIVAAHVRKVKDLMI